MHSSDANAIVPNVTTRSSDRAVRFVDTTLRDGQESLWATSMRTGMILPIASRMDEAGFEGIEIIATTNFKKQIRELKENPWERIRSVARRIKKTPLRAVRNRYMAAFQISPNSVSDLWLERMAANGVQEIRLSDPSNTACYWKDILNSASKFGLRTIINLIFSISPKHSDDYYAQITREAAKLDPYRLCLKDPGGLLTPERTRSLIPAVLKNSNGIPVELHAHCNTNLGLLYSLEAVQLGIRSLNTALPPLANGSSNPSLFSVTKNLRALAYEPMVNEELLKPASEHFDAIARRERLPIGAPLEYSQFHFVHQVPGGMISNFRYQLSKAGMEERLPEVLEEIGRVRAELGYPIMVTPYSQFVGVQATMNVILGERYKEVPDEVIQYALGLWGAEESSSIEPNIKDKILGRPRAQELARWIPPQPSVKQFRDRLGGAGVSDDDLLLRYLSSEEDVEAMKAAGRSKNSFSVKHPVIMLLESLLERNERRQIYVQTKNMRLRLEKRGRIHCSGPDAE